MRVLKILFSLIMTMVFMALVDVILILSPLPSWTWTVMIIFQSVYVTLILGLLLPWRALLNPE